MIHQKYYDHIIMLTITTHSRDPLSHQMLPREYMTKTLIIQSNDFVLIHPSNHNASDLLTLVDDQVSRQVNTLS